MSTVTTFTPRTVRPSRAEPTEHQAQALAQLWALPDAGQAVWTFADMGLAPRAVSSLVGRGWLEQDRTASPRLYRLSPQAPRLGPQQSLPGLEPSSDAWSMRARGDMPEPTPPALHMPRPGRLIGTPQQEAFWGTLAHASGHVVLEARAGTGKSTSCREGMHRLLFDNPGLAIRYCCFNKKIAEEFAQKAPAAAEVGTMHRFGNQELIRVYGSTLDAQKTYSVLDGLGWTNVKRYLRVSLSKLVSLAKNHAYTHDTENIHARLSDLIDAYDVETWNERPWLVRVAVDVLKASAECTSIVDFDDMLWLPVVHQLRFPLVDFLMVDEAQDLNPVQHQMAQLLCESGRTVIVGDPYQAIYGFRGADSRSIETLGRTLDAVTMPLTVTFRCPASHVAMARRYVPDFEAAPEAPDGTLVYEDQEHLSDLVEPGHLVLCRTNAPLIRECLRSVARRIPATVRGRAIGEGLLTVLRKSRSGDARTLADMGRALDAWRAKEVFRLESRDGQEAAIERLGDQCDCLHAIAESCSQVTDVPQAIKEIFSDEDARERVIYSTVHRAKGSEARTVHYLDIPYSVKRDRERPPQPWTLEQRRNLQYVALTRSLDHLTILTPNTRGF